MAEGFELAIAVLAAGQSRRFGERDKLRALFRGKPLGLHMPDRLSRIPAAKRFVVSASASHVCVPGWEAAGFAPVANPNADEGMGTSVAVAARIARRAGCDGLLIALADMPLVPRDHFRLLVETAQDSGTGAIIASGHGNTRSPPALFGRDHFDALAQLSGDEGARPLLQQARFISCDPAHLIDIDTPEALAALE